MERGVDNNLNHGNNTNHFYNFLFRLCIFFAGENKIIYYFLKKTNTMVKTLSAFDHPSFNYVSKQLKRDLVNSNELILEKTPFDTNEFTY